MRTILSSFIFITLMTCSYAGALTLTLQPRDLSPAEKAQAQAIMAKTLAQLPSKMRAALPFNLSIEFVTSEASNDRAHLGAAKFSQNKILLNKEFLRNQVSGIYSDKRFRQTLAHEIAHFYDKAVGISDNAQFRALVGWRSGGNGLAQINNFKRRLPDVYMNVKLV